MWEHANLVVTHKMWDHASFLIHQESRQGVAARPDPSPVAVQTRRFGLVKVTARRRRRLDGEPLDASDKIPFIFLGAHGGGDSRGYAKPKASPAFGTSNRSLQSAFQVNSTLMRHSSIILSG